MFEKLAEVEELYQELERRMADPDLVNDMDEYRRVHKQYSDLTEDRHQVPRIQRDRAAA